MHSYVFFKLIHVLAVIAFMGNIVTGLFWMRRAAKTGDRSIIYFTMESIIRSDKVFTIPGVIVITAGGIAAAVVGGIPLLKTGWIFWSLIFFVASGIAFMAKVGPLQKKIADLMRHEHPAPSTWEQYRRALTQWERWGLFALVTPLLALAMMIAKHPAHSGL